MDYEEEFEGEEGEVEVPDVELLLLIQEVTECFWLFDQKRTGQMPMRFLGRALKGVGVNLTPFELEEVTEKFDKNGVIELLDFQEYTIEKRREADPHQELRDAFEALDPENEGVIPVDRFKKWMMTLGDPLTENEAKELCKLGDPANHGQFVYGDVIPILLF